VSKKIKELCNKYQIYLSAKQMKELDNKHNVEEGIKRASEATWIKNVDKFGFILGLLSKR